MLMEEDPPPNVQQQQCSSSSSADLPDLNPGISPSAPSATVNPFLMSTKYSPIQSPAVKRFHQTHGTAPAVVSEMASLPPRAKSARNYTEAWVQNYHGTQLPQGSLSSTPSITSLSSFASNCSALSVQTELSVITDFNPNEFVPCFPGVAATNINQSISCGASTSSFAENMDPNFFQIMDNHLCLLLEKLGNFEEKSILEALYTLNEIARTRKFVYCGNVERIIEILCGLFHLLSLPNASQKIQNVIMSTLHEMTSNRVCIDAFKAFIYRTRGAVIEAICRYLKPEEKCGRFAITVLHTLFYNKQTGKISRCCAQHESVLVAVMRVVQSPHCNHKHIALDTLRLILHNSMLKAAFKKHNGMEMCLNLMRTEAEEKILYRSALLMSQLLNSAEMGAHFINCGGVQIVSKHLDHASPKLILTIARCLAMISDSPNLAQQNIETALQHVVQILGSRDMDLVFQATGFLANAPSNNLEAKIYLHNNYAINNLMRLMHACTESELIVNERTKTLEVVDNIMLALTKLTSNYGDMHFYVRSACLQIMTACIDMTRPPSALEAHDAMLNVLATEWSLPAPSVLLNVIAADYFNVGSRAIMILNRIIENIPMAITKFEFSRDYYNNQNYSTHLMNALFAAAEEYWRMAPNISSIDQKKVAQLETLFKRILTLMSFFVENQPNLKLQIGLICNSTRNPVLLLPYVGINLQVPLVKFVDALTDDNDQLNGLWGSNERVVKILKEQTMQSTHPEIVHFSNVILQKLNAI